MHEQTNQPGPDEQRGVRRTTAILLGIMALLVVWYLVSDRLTPYTASGRLKTYVVAVVPDVSGYVAEVPVNKNQLLAPGDTLLQIETRRFEIAVEAAEAALQLAGQAIGVDTAAVATATANLAAAQAEVDEADVIAARTFRLEKKGAASREAADKARGRSARAKAALLAAESELKRAKEKLGTGGEADNPRIRSAAAALEEARLNLSRTTLKAPGQGYIGGLKIDEGAYIAAGQPAMSFIAVDDIWVEAYMTENNLANVGIGDKVELAFDAFPGQIFEGKVKSVGAGVSTGKKANPGGLATAQKTRAWLRDPQRFPVIIQTTNYEQDLTRSRGGVRLNSQVDVTIYTGDHPFWNALGKAWMRLMSWLSYAY